MHTSAKCEPPPGAETGRKGLEFQDPEGDGLTAGKDRKDLDESKASGDGVFLSRIPGAFPMHPNSKSA